MMLFLVLSQAASIAGNGSPAIIPGVGIREVRLGETADKVVRSMGRPDEISESADGESFYYSYFARGISILFDKKGALLRARTIFIYSGLEGGYDKPVFKKYRGTTSESISVDSRYNEVVRAYGKPDEKGELSLIPIPSKWIAYKARGMGFSFRHDNGRMIYLYVMRPEKKRTDHRSAGNF